VGDGTETAALARPGRRRDEDDDAACAEGRRKRCRDAEEAMAAGGGGGGTAAAAAVPVLLRWWWPSVASVWLFMWGGRGRAAPLLGSWGVQEGRCSAKWQPPCRITDVPTSRRVRL